MTTRSEEWRAQMAQWLEDHQEEIWAEYHRIKAAEDARRCQEDEALWAARFQAIDAEAGTDAGKEEEAR